MGAQRTWTECNVVKIHGIHGKEIGFGHHPKAQFERFII